MIGSATACSLLLSPDDLTRGAQGEAAGDGSPPIPDGGESSDAGGGLPLCHGPTHQVTACRDFCKGLPNPVDFCDDFDDGGPDATFLPPSAGCVAHFGSLSINAAESVSPPGSLIAGWPSDAAPETCAFASWTFNAISTTGAHLSAVHLSLDMLLEPETTPYVAQPLALVFGPNTKTPSHLTVVKQGATSLREHDTTGVDGGDTYFNHDFGGYDLPDEQWAHLDIDVDTSTHVVTVLLDGASAVDAGLHGIANLASVELRLGLDYAQSNRAVRVRYDNVVLYFH